MTIAPAPRPPVLDPATVQRTRLANGLTVLLRRDAAAPVAAVVTYVKAGYFDETDDVAGISHVLEHMFFKGTATRGVGAIAKETKASGGYLNAHTIYDHTAYYAVLPSSGFAAGLEVQADAYAHSVIDAAELRKELEVIIQEAKRKADNPHAVAVETLYELLHDRHRMRRWRIGHEPGLRALTRDALLGFYRNFYQPRNTVLAIVGDVDVERTLADVERLYGALPDQPVMRTPGPAEPEHADFRYREWTGDIAQTQLAAGWRTPGLLHRDTPLLDVVGAVLGSGRASRLYRAVREHKLASSITAYNYTPDEVGVFVLQAETPAESAVDAARATWAQLRNLLDEGVGEQEVERARRLFEARWLRRLETVEGQANYLAEWEAAGDWRLGERYLERLLCATADSVSDVARRYLTPERAALVVYRPEGTPPFADGAEAARARLRDAPSRPLAPTPARQAAASAGRTDAPTLECREAGVHVYRTVDGLPLLVWPKPGATITYAGVFVAGGAGEEPRAEAGLTKLLTRTALKGTERRTATQIAEDAELVGASLGGSVSADSFGWSVSVPAPHATAALDLLADVVQHATIPEAAFETERTIALADVAALRDDMYRQPMRLLLEAAYDGHPYGTPASGDEASLAALTADAVRAWHRQRVGGGRVVVGLVGDGDPDQLAALAARHFAGLREGGWEPGTPPTWPASTAQRAEERDKAQTALALAFPGPGRRDPDRFAAELLAGVASGLGGRFFDELRDRQSLAYTVHAHASERILGGLFAAYIATSPEQEAQARDGLLAEFARLREHPVSDEELQRAKTYALGTHAIARESGGSRLGEMVDAWLTGTGLAELAEYETRITALTVADLQSLAVRYFDPERRVEGIVRGTGKKV
ncbi:MAG TPA: pitrilysin family protein [Gemmatimonadaceae bacterium]